MEETENLLRETYGDWRAVADDDPQLTDPDISGGRVDWLADQRQVYKDIFLQDGKALIEKVLPHDRKNFIEAHYSWASKTKASTWVQMRLTLEDIYALYKENGIDIVKFFGKVTQKCYAENSILGDRVDISSDVGLGFLRCLKNIPRIFRIKFAATIQAVLPNLLHYDNAIHDELREILQWDFSQKSEEETGRYLSQIQEYLEKNPLRHQREYHEGVEAIRKIAKSFSLQYKY